MIPLEALQSFRKDCSGCTKCSLSNYRLENDYKVVLPSTDTTGRVNLKAKALVIGEAPGLEEAISGVPFVGRSGKLLRALFAHAGLENLVYITNTVKCRPPSNAVPSDLQMQTCAPYLTSEINIFEQIEGAICITVGKTAASALDLQRKILGRDLSIPVYHIYHPSYLLRNGITIDSLNASPENYVPVLKATVQSLGEVATALRAYSLPYQPANGEKNADL